MAAARSPRTSCGCSTSARTTAVRTSPWNCSTGGRSASTCGRIRRLPLAARIDLIVQLYSGLEAAHAQGVVHRDVKPGNIMVYRDGHLTILDFGLARLQSSTLTANGAVVGSPGYMSPEQAEGRRVDQRSDIFSAAAVGYLILSGREPFDAKNLPLALQAILHEMPPAPLSASEAPDPLARVLLKALEKSPDARYQTCAEVLADLVRVKAHGGAFVIRKLIIGNGRSEREILLVGNITIGRDPACHVSEPDPLLSRRHAEIIANVHGVSVRDLEQPQRHPRQRREDAASRCCCLATSCSSGTCSFATSKRTRGTADGIGEPRHGLPRRHRRRPRRRPTISTGYRPDPAHAPVDAADAAAQSLEARTDAVARPPHVGAATAGARSHQAAVPRGRAAFDETIAIPVQGRGQRRLRPDDGRTASDCAVAPRHHARSRAAGSRCHDAGAAPASCIGRQPLERPGRHHAGDDRYRPVTRIRR